MAYQSLYRRYRPQRFAEVRGQDHLVSALRNAVQGDRVGHAYLFSGPRGTGKTTTARILAKVLNCPNAVEGEPCGVCESCVAIEHGTSFDVHELDAASNNGVEAIRDLITKTAMGTPGRTKVYILDEVHMLSTAASNALLKTLEETPEHVVFVLATTDPQKVLPTIRSRTQHFELHLLSAEELTALAEFVIADAELDVAPEAVDYVVRAAAGSARDMLSALDQVVAGGLPDDGDALDELVEALCDRDTGRALIAVEQALDAGRSPRLLGEQLISRLRDVFLAAMKMELTRLPDQDRERVAAQAERMGPAGATRALEVLGDAFVGIQDAPDQRIPLEVALVRLTRPEADTSISALLDRITRLEHGVAPGAGSAPAPPPAAPSRPSPAPAAAAPPAAPPDDRPDPIAASPASDEPEGAGPAPESHQSDADAGTDSAEARPPGAGMAAGARQVLQARKQAKSSGRRPASTPGSAPASSPSAGSTSGTESSPAPTSTSAEPSPAAPAAPAPTAAPSGPRGASAATPAAPATSGGGDLPTRDELTLAWGDTILAGLPARAKAFFGAGRFAEVSGGQAVFALPNAPHAERCEACRPDVEAALAAYFGRAVPLRLAVDEDLPPADRGSSSGSGAVGSSSSPSPEADEDVDLTQLTDAHDVATTSVDRVRELFPGAELVDEG
jgi:DNA polymerase III subunit gamma/tau